MTSIPRLAFAALLACAVPACSAETTEQLPETAATATAQTHPVSGLEIVPVTLTTATGTHVIQAEVADTPQTQARGLMFRTELGSDEGMIFPYAAPRELGFWMRNTVIPLDLIFIDDARTVINIEQGEPYSEESIRSDRPGIAVLELAEGRASELGLEPGDSVEW